jgi:K+-transporting ATPase KdpF subunit
MGLFTCDSAAPHAKCAPPCRRFYAKYMFSLPCDRSILYAFHAIFRFVAYGLVRRLTRRARDVRHNFPHDRGGLFRHFHGLRRRLRAALARLAMDFDYTLGALVTALILAYLVYALVRPEKF